MQKTHITSENILYFLAISLALSLRFLNLGVTPLSEDEAALALKAWDLSYGISSHPAYIALTRSTFFLLGSSNALARFWPALAGSIIVLIPAAYRSILGRSTALILAFCLALDPGLVSISRLVGSSIMAISFAALAGTSFYNRKPVWGGIFSGLAMLSGPSIWVALLGAIIYGLLLKIRRLSFLGISNSGFLHARTDQKNLKISLKYFLGTILVVATLWFSYPLGLSQWAQNIVIFLRSWVSKSGISPNQVILGLILYEPFAIVFCIIAVVEDNQLQRRLVRVLSILAVTLLAIVLLIPGREVTDAAWVLMPVWVLAAVGLSYYWRSGWHKIVVLGQAITQFVVLVLGWLIIAGSIHLVSQDEMLRSVLLIGLLGFSVLTFIFIGLGWSWLSARQGLVLGIGSVLLLYGLATVFNLSQIIPANPTEFWLPQRRTGQADLLIETLNDISLRETGIVNGINGIMIVDSPALRWALRDFNDIIFSHKAEIIESTNPAIILASSLDDGKLLSVPYRGQDFIWQLNAKTTKSIPTSWDLWLKTREAQLVKESIILWVRDDIFFENPQFTPIDS